MSYRKLLLHPPIGVGVVVIAALLIASALNRQNGPDQQSAAAPSEAAKKVTAAPPPAAAKKNSVFTDWSRPDCKQPKDHDEADLCQQVRMANAAESTVFLNAAQVAAALLTLVGLVITVHYARKAANAAIAAANAANDANRAWLAVKLKLGGDFCFEPAGAAIFVEVEITNIGKTVAINAHTTVDMVMHSNDVSKQLKALADGDRKIDTSASRMVLPGESYDRPWFPSMDRSVVEAAQLGNTIFPTIIGCVTYQVLPDLSLHQTAFRFDLSKGNALIPFGENVPREQLEVHPGPGGFAD